MAYLGVSSQPFLRVRFLLAGKQNSGFYSVFESRFTGSSQVATPAFECCVEICVCDIVIEKFSGQMLFQIRPPERASLVDLHTDSVH